MKEKIAKIISIVTVAPIVAFISLTLLYSSDKGRFNNNVLWYIISVVFLTLLPISAYALKPVLPNYKDKGREGERKLAFILAVIGYVIGTLWAVIFNAPKDVKIIFIIYLLSGVVLSFLNKVLKIKASGHACGVSGPVTFLLFFMGAKLWYIIIVLPLVFFARVSQKRHTYKELLLGTAVGVFSALMVLGAYFLTLKI